MKIVIVGGGTAGWISAAFILKETMGYDVTIVEKDGINSRDKIEKINSGVFPFKMNDKKISYALKKTIGKNLKATNNIEVYKKAKIIISCIDFNTLEKKKGFQKKYNFIQKKNF